MARAKGGDSKQEIILQAALKLFSEKGYHAASTKEIAAESGVAEGLLFYYFRGKKELLHSVVSRFSFQEAAQDRLEELLGLDKKEALVRYGKLYFSFLERNRDYLFLIWSPEMMANEAVSAEVVKLLAGMAEQGGKLLAEHSAKDGIPDKNRLEAAMSMMLSSLFTYFFIGERMKNRSPQADEAFIQSTVDVLLNGI